MYSKKKFVSYEEARTAVKEFNIKSARDFRRWIKENNINYIPSAPDRVYKNIGWISWGSFLNTGSIHGGVRKYTVNNDYFKTFSSNMAYVLGFWFADGYMNEEFNFFTITQHGNDKYLLEEILKNMDSNYPLICKKGINVFSFSIYSSEILKDLKKFGGHQAKSLTIQFPTNIPKKYMSDFIRGVFDGDGCVYLRKGRNRYVSTFASGSTHFIYDMLEILKREIGNHFTGSIQRNKKGVYTLHIASNSTIKLREYMYRNVDENSLYLKRKYDKLFAAGEITKYTFISYKKAQKFIKRLKITNHRDWNEYKRSNNVFYIPSYSELGKIYKNDGWINWATFIGKNNILQVSK